SSFSAWFEKKRLAASVPTNGVHKEGGIRIASRPARAAGANAGSAVRRSGINNAVRPTTGRRTPTRQRAALVNQSMSRQLERQVTLVLLLQPHLGEQGVCTLLDRLHTL